MLLDYQEENLAKLRDAVQHHDVISIVGKPNSGRMEVVSYLKQENNVIIKILPNEKESQRCEDMLIAIKEMKNLKRNRHNLDFDISLAYGAFGISFGAETTDLYALENELVKRINRLSFRRNIIIVIKNPSQIDAGTHSVINRVLNQKCRIFKKRLIKIEICDSNKDVAGEIVYFDSLNNDKKNLYTTLRKLNLNPNIQLDDNVIDFIFKNADGNIALLSKIVNDLNSQSVDSKFQSIDNNNTIKELATHGIALSNFENELKNILTILSISDRYFTSLDLSFLLKKEVNIIELYLDYGVEYYFINNDDNGYQIIFQIIKKIFATVPDYKKTDIYNNIIKLIRTHYPDNYHEKYKFAKLAKQGKASIYLLQDIMKQIRFNGSYDHNIYDNLLTDIEINIIESYYDAYCKSCNNLYKQSICILEKSIADYELTSPIKQEFGLLLSQSLIKSIKIEDRLKAVDTLYYDDHDPDIDEYLRYRLDARKISAFIHIGKYNDARIQSKKTVERLIKLVENTRSPGCEYFLNIIYRKYCNIYPYESSIAPINKSVQFFSSHQQYARAAYIALNNALALNLINGDVKNAKANIIQIKELSEKYFNIRFPRPEMMENNRLILDLLHNPNIERKTISENFKRLYSTSRDLADNILIASNYAISLALEEKLNDAVRILTYEYDKLNNTTDLEGIYKYRIATNLAVCMFLEDNTRKTNALSMLSSINLSLDDIHSAERSAELKLIIKTMNDISECSSAAKWIKAYQQNVDTPKGYYCLHQYGFVFTTLFDWDDE